VGFTGLFDAGFVFGPFRRAVVTLGAQTRLIVPGGTQATFTYEGSSGEELHTVRWDSPLLGLGPRIAVAVHIGNEHSAFIELGAGGGAVIAQDAAYFTVGARVGAAFGL
jgi:hypothetical protein